MKIFHFHLNDIKSIVFDGIDDGPNHVQGILERDHFVPSLDIDVQKYIPALVEVEEKMLHEHKCENNINTGIFHVGLVN